MGIAFRAVRRDNAFGERVVRPMGEERERISGTSCTGSSTGGRVRSGELVGQAIKCTRWMPRHRPAKKDVASCEKPRGAASKLRSGDVRLGKPGRGHALSPEREPTRGTETSKYPQEEKSTEIP